MNESIVSPLCHTERSEVSKSKRVVLQNHLDSSVASLPQNDKIVDFLKKYCHTLCYCHTERSKVSKHKDEDLQGNVVCLDSSLSTKAQNDKKHIKES